MSYRIIRGFSRLGIGAAVLVAFCGVGLTAILAIDGYSRATHPRGLSDMDVGLAPPFDPTKPYEYEVDGKWWRYDPVTGYAPIPARESNPPPPGFVIDQPPSAAFVAAKSAGLGLGITAVLALAVFGFFRGLGWVVTGFARD